jgi:hypothetical protein
MVGALALAAPATWNGLGCNVCRRKRDSGALVNFDPSFISFSEIEQASLRKFVRHSGHTPAAFGHFFEDVLVHSSIAGPCMGEAVACGDGLSSRDRCLSARRATAGNRIAILRRRNETLSLS